MGDEKLKTLPEMLRVREELRAGGKRLVFTNGCFDLLHVGHVRYLNQARALGDVLLVGLNSDNSVRLLKGERRPIVAQSERAEILAALSSVDYVVVFDDLTPQNIIDAVIPDVLVKGADWGITEIVGRSTVEKAGGRVQNIPLVDGASTTGLVDKIVEHFGPHRQP